MSDDLLLEFDRLTEELEEIKTDLAEVAAEIVERGGALLADTHQVSVEEIISGIGSGVSVDPGPISEPQRLTAARAEEYRRMHAAAIAAKADKILAAVKIAAAIAKTAAGGV